MGEMGDAPEAIRLRGVRQNNLKGFDLDVPLGKLIVVTGLSGAGKSSLVFETLHAEGQRRYVETFSPYTRQFLEMLDRPRVDSIENIRPSIAIQQRNSVKTSRSTVGTMTELTDYFKVWFGQVAQLFDPDSGKRVEDDNPQLIWQKLISAHPGENATLCFDLAKPDNIDWKTVLDNVSKQGFTRVRVNGETKKLADLLESDPSGDALTVAVDKTRLEESNRSRFIESAQTCLHFGQGRMRVVLAGCDEFYSEGLHSPDSDRRFKPATPATFSFNSPIGACERCRGFGRVISIDPKLVVPDESLTLNQGAIKPFTGEVYKESLNDLRRVADQYGISMDVPFRDLTEEQKDFVWNGEPDYVEGEWMHMWYGINRFFEWLESNVYKMHVRVFLSKFRAYTTCPDCRGARLKPEALNWKWQGRTLPDLYQMPIENLAELVRSHSDKIKSRRDDLALEGILSRLAYLEQVGLGYLTLDRSSRSLSGGETQRVTLTSCLGTSLVDTLFVLDEPSIGLHTRDIDRLIGILRRLTDMGNTVVVVEHDDAVMRAADHLIEIGPLPGERGGHVVYAGEPSGILRHKPSITGAYLSGHREIPVPRGRRVVEFTKRKKGTAALSFFQATKHNLRELDVSIPLGRLVCLTGVSGSGKSTLLDNVINQGLLRARGKAADNPAETEGIEGEDLVGEVSLVDQGPVSRTPRSNPAVFTEAWDEIRKLFAKTDAAKSAGLTHAHFSFNSGHGRCEHCQGLGHEKIEMQFLADVYVPCPICEARRFKPEVLAIQWEGLSVDAVLDLDVRRACEVFSAHKKINHLLRPLLDVGLGYLRLGQPLNTLSGGESQRLKLVKYLNKLQQGALLLLDEPTTGLHLEDIRRLITLLQKLVDAGHSLVVIEHQLDLIKCADWVIEMGPDAGAKGGQVTFCGTPEDLARQDTVTGRFLADRIKKPSDEPLRYAAFQALPSEAFLEAAEPLIEFRKTERKSSDPKGHQLEIVGAREHNLQNISVNIPHREMTVVTGVSGSGKSSLAFDIVFAEGQRRFMDSMSAYARQFVEQLARPEVDALYGIAPTVAIEQRVTRGSRKSTVATITEVAQYLRLLYAKAGVQHSPETGQPVQALSRDSLRKLLTEEMASTDGKSAKFLYLCAPVVRARKGHHEPLANWARDHGYRYLRCDGQLLQIENFQKLDRYREHDIELAIPVREKGLDSEDLEGPLDDALHRGKGQAFLLHPVGRILRWFSTTRTDPATGEAFPELDPKHFSWNSAKGWCPMCRGHGYIADWMYDSEAFDALPNDVEHGESCPECEGTRLNRVARAVRLPVKEEAVNCLRKSDVLSPHSRASSAITLPELLSLTPERVLDTLRSLNLDERGSTVAAEIIPEIRERLRFLGLVGLEYLSLARATNTLSGGEAQRIRLAAQLGSNLSGVLYVLDEPSIGLHARDNAALIKSLLSLRDKGNTLLVVEHDDQTMRAADRVLDLGPGAGINGGHILANGHYTEIIEHADSLTGKCLREPCWHPLRESYRSLPKPWSPRSRPKRAEWLVLREPRLRNLKGGDLCLPLGRLIMVCGISGAGKSTLIRDTLQPLVASAIAQRESKLMPNNLAKSAKGESPLRNAFRELRDGNGFRAVIEVDQEPIGKTPRSTPATYIGAFDLIRDFFASLPEAQMRGFGSGTFSFNTKGGRCEACKGAGRIKLEMAFMPDSYVDCEECGGSRYGEELKEIRWNGKNIGDVLAMSFAEAADFFDFSSRLHDMMRLMCDTGLGYLKLGQSSPTLSGGEAQRLKLVSELVHGLPTYKEKSQGILRRNLYLLEEPTIGLHMSDCKRLVELLHRLVDQGHTVVVIEHNVDLLAEADYLVEIGAEGGERGGEILFQGPLSEFSKVQNSPTWPFLSEVLG